MLGPLERSFSRVQSLRRKNQQNETANSSLSTSPEAVTANSSPRACPEADTVNNEQQGSTPSVSIRREGITKIPLQVNTLSERYKATTWMVTYAAENGDDKIISK